MTGHAPPQTAARPALPQRYNATGNAPKTGPTAAAPGVRTGEGGQSPSVPTEGTSAAKVCAVAFVFFRANISGGSQ